MKQLRCRDVGFDCEGVVTGQTDDDVMRQAAAHAQEVHGLTDDQVNGPDFAAQIAPLVHDRS